MQINNNDMCYFFASVGAVSTSILSAIDKLDTWLYITGTFVLVIIVLLVSELEKNGRKTKRKN